jgi:hypothetical protein
VGECLTGVGGESAFEGGDIMDLGEDFLLSGAGPGIYVRWSHILPRARTRSTRDVLIERSNRVQVVVLFEPTNAVVDHFLFRALTEGFCMLETAKGVLAGAVAELLLVE